MKDAMKVGHATQKITKAINKEFSTDLTRSSLRSDNTLELLWLDPGILVILEFVEGELRIQWVRPDNPSSDYQEVQRRLEKCLSFIGEFVGAGTRGS